MSERVISLLLLMKDIVTCLKIPGKYFNLCLDIQLNIIQKDVEFVTIKIYRYNSLLKEE